MVKDNNGQQRGCRQQNMLVDSTLENAKENTHISLIGSYLCYLIQAHKLCIK